MFMFESGATDLNSGVLVYLVQEINWNSTIKKLKNT